MKNVTRQTNRKFVVDFSIRVGDENQSKTNKQYPSQIQYSREALQGQKHGFSQILRVKKHLQRARTWLNISIVSTTRYCKCHNIPTGKYFTYQFTDSWNVVIYIYWQKSPNFNTRFGCLRVVRRSRYRLEQDQY